MQEWVRFAPKGNAVKDFVHTLKGLNLKAQGREAHPGKPQKDGFTLKGLHHEGATQMMKPFQGKDNLPFQNPGCAQARPWALRCNPFGVKTTNTPHKPYGLVFPFVAANAARLTSLAVDGRSFRGFVCDTLDVLANKG